MPVTRKRCAQRVACRGWQAQWQGFAAHIGWQHFGEFKLGTGTATERLE